MEQEDLATIEISVVVGGFMTTSLVTIARVKRCYHRCLRTPSPLSTRCLGIATQSSHMCDPPNRKSRNANTTFIFCSSLGNGKVVLAFCELARILYVRLCPVSSPFLPRMT